MANRISQEFISQKKRDFDSKNAERNRNLCISNEFKFILKHILFENCRRQTL
jgi:hypothetical protein